MANHGAVTKTQGVVNYIGVTTRCCGPTVEARDHERKLAGHAPGKSLISPAPARAARRVALRCAVRPHPRRSGPSVPAATPRPQATPAQAPHGRETPNDPAVCPADYPSLPGAGHHQLSWGRPTPLPCGHAPTGHRPSSRSQDAHLTNRRPTTTTPTGHRFHRPRRPSHTVTPAATRTHTTPQSRHGVTQLHHPPLRNHTTPSAAMRNHTAPSVPIRSHTAPSIPTRSHTTPPAPIRDTPANSTGP
ncbi:hypothetical protein FHU36_006100 [Nonomuraea muscovyensis]|uniref:Uncharacterized protein n=1 Tax=Nonomuraea muscovyensis TaxID=1124761 RepID=A0A7X0C6S6_9ACTN|nr:hypothetical protein [Nonomuraea muscovyensis]